MNKGLIIGDNNIIPPGELFITAINVNDTEFTESDDGKLFVGETCIIDEQGVITGSVKYLYSTVDTDFTTDARVTVYYVDASPGNIVIDLAVKKNFVFIRTDASGNTVTITPSSGVINGAASVALSSQYAQHQVFTDGTDFYYKAAGAGGGDMIAANNLSDVVNKATARANLQLSTKAEFDAACTDGNFLYVGDINQYTDELAQDAVGTILADSSTIDFTYTDGTPEITADVKDNSITEDKQVLADNTTHNVSTSMHGYAPKGDGDTTKFLNANGAYSVPAGGGGDIALTKQVPTADQVITAGYSAYVSQNYEIGNGLTLEIGADSFFEIG